jgi:hypothetical protein
MEQAEPAGLPGRAVAGTSSANCATDSFTGAAGLLWMSRLHHYIMLLTCFHWHRCQTAAAATAVLTQPASWLLLPPLLLLPPALLLLLLLLLLLCLSIPAAPSSICHDGDYRAADDLHPLRVMSLFRNITDEDLDVLDIAGEAAIPCFKSQPLMALAVWLLLEILVFAFGDNVSYPLPCSIPYPSICCYTLLYRSTRQSRHSNNCWKFVACHTFVVWHQRCIISHTYTGINWESDHRRSLGSPARGAISLLWHCPCCGYSLHQPCCASVVKL